MNLPINIDDLFTAKTVEWERLEFKAGWNPEDVVRALCAFANDFHNLGGGYIVLGVAEKNGRPILPPRGLSVKEFDKIQKEIIALGYKIQPYYHPIIFPVVYRKKNILILWAVAGQVRPYKAPASLSEKNKVYRYYIRKGSVTIAARDQNERELLEMAATVPFDDRGNRSARIDALDLGLIREYLKQVRSALFEESAKMEFIRLCRSMNLAEGPDEHVLPKNVGLMFFNPEPQKYFSQTQIDIVHFPEGPDADSFTEKTFKGPVHVMLKDALAYLESQVIKEKIRKRSGRPEADRFYNYPYAALKEALCNAVYHRSYEIREPVEIRILPDHITINSFPGPDRSISKKDLKSLKFLSRRYRNRRVGEFLKELELTEGRGTGIPRMLRELKKNSSPLPVFHTDEDRSFLMVEFPIQPLFLEDIQNQQVTGQVAGQVTEQVTEEINRLLSVLDGEMSRREIQDKLVLKGRANFEARYLKPALEAGLIELTIPSKPNSRLQRYRLTDEGKRMKAG
ncbi:MAG: putative DNA binding domain-containing protein [Candidatus Omnitrophica bacterium]|nr:putative DNA binding domain-containing protein [Candidatus Omnitrophota bacterium]